MRSDWIPRPCTSACRRWATACAPPASDPPGGGASPAAAAGTRSSGLLGRVRSRPRDFLTLLSGLLLLLAVAIEVAGVGPEWLTSAVLALSMVVGGYYVFRKGITNLWLTRQLDINFLMTIAALGAAAIGEWAEAALVVFLFSLGETLEGYTMDRARNSIRSLMQLAPPEATLLDVCLDCEEHVGQRPAGRHPVHERRLPLVRARDARARGRPGGGRPHPGEAGRAHRDGRPGAWPALRRSTRRPSRARACRWKSSRAAMCSRARSTARARSRSR